MFLIKESQLNQNLLISYSKQIFDYLDVSELTRKDYKFRIHLFLKFIQNKEININSFLQFKREMNKRIEYSVSTKNKYLATARIFLKELHRIGIIPVDITFNVKSFKQIKKHKLAGLNDSEVKTILKYADNLIQNPINIRLKAILHLLTYQGLRQIEISRLNINDIDFIQKTALVQGKGQDDKESIPLHPETVIVLEEYKQAWKISDGALFISTSNRSKNQRLSPRSIRMIIFDVFKKLGIQKTVHGFRHYFTTKLIDAYNGNLLEVAKFTRHRNLEMLQVYYDKINFDKNLPTFYNAFSI